jgi:hypothetical protein
VKDLAVELEHRPGALAEVGEALGAAGVSIEGGGAFVAGGVGLAHFLVSDATVARAALERAGLRVLGVRDVVTLRLRQDEPGQLGHALRRMAEAGVDVEAQYSDHAGNLVLVVDDPARGHAVAARWGDDARRR